VRETSTQMKLAKPRSHRIGSRTSSRYWCMNEQPFTIGIYPEGRSTEITFYNVVQSLVSIPPTRPDQRADYLGLLRMKSLRWYQRAPKLPLMPQDFSMCIRLQCRGFWLKLVPGLYQGNGLVRFCDTLRAGERKPKIKPNLLRMINSATSPISAAIFGALSRRG
jgi:hypothetical protein